MNISNKILVSKVLKGAKYVSSHFTKEDIKVASKPMKMVLNIINHQINVN